MFWLRTNTEETLFSSTFFFFGGSGPFIQTSPQIYIWVLVVTSLSTITISVLLLSFHAQAGQSVWVLIDRYLKVNEMLALLGFRRNRTQTARRYFHGRSRRIIFARAPGLPWESRRQRQGIAYPWVWCKGKQAKKVSVWQFRNKLAAFHSSSNPKSPDFNSSSTKNFRILYLTL
jgi:hypothetical protein